MYGSATELVLTFYGSGVHRFTLDPSLGEFIHIEGDVKIPCKPKVIKVLTKKAGYETPFS